MSLRVSTRELEIGGCTSGGEEAEKILSWDVYISLRVYTREIGGCTSDGELTLRVHADKHTLGWARY